MGSPSHRVEQSVAVVVEVAKRTHHAVTVVSASLLQAVGDRLPLAEFRGHHPIDDLVHLHLDHLWGVGDDLALEIGFDLGLVE